MSRGRFTADDDVIVVGDDLRFEGGVEHFHGMPLCPILGEATAIAFIRSALALAVQVLSSP